MNERTVRHSLVGRSLDLYLDDWSVQIPIYLLVFCLGTAFAAVADLKLHLSPLMVVFSTVAFTSAMLFVVPATYVLLQDKKEKNRGWHLKQFFESGRFLATYGILGSKQKEGLDASRRIGELQTVNLPNSLTLLRIFIVPLLVVVLLTPFFENWLGLPRHIFGVALFLGAALTDFLDGHFARSRNQVTRLGQLLDPIADKLLISAALISLVENQLAPAWAVVIIIGREFAVTGLRSIAAADGVIISASKMGKFKMLVQVLTVALLIVSSVAGKPPVGNFGQPFPAIAFWSVPELRVACQHLFGNGSVVGSDWQVLLYTAGRAMLWLVVISSCLSMYGYFRSFYRSVVASGRAEYAGKQSGAPIIPVTRD